MVRNPVSVLKGWFLKRTEANVAAERAGMIFLTQVGVLGDRFTAMDGLSDENFLDWSSHFFRAALPWLLPRREFDMADKIIAWLDNYEIYQKMVMIDNAYGGNSNSKLKTPENIKENVKPENEKVNPQATISDLSEPEEDMRSGELDRSLERTKKFLVNDAKYLLGLSFRKEDLASSDTLIISKPEAGAPAKEHAESYEGIEMISERLNQISRELQELKESRKK